MNKKYPKILGSSVDASKLSMTFKGIAVGLIPAIAIIFKLSGNESLDEKTLYDAVDSIGDVIVTAGALVSSVMVVMGLIRKFAVYLKLIKPQNPTE